MFYNIQELHTYDLIPVNNIFIQSYNIWKYDHLVLSTRRNNFLQKCMSETWPVPVPLRKGSYKGSFKYPVNNTLGSWTKLRFAIWKRVQSKVMQYRDRSMFWKDVIIESLIYFCLSSSFEISKFL